MLKYERIPLTVDVRYYEDGTIVPIKVIFGDKSYEINKIYNQKRYSPQVVASISPIEYSVSINGVEKKIYYEESTKNWFSIREIQC